MKLYQRRFIINGQSFSIDFQETYKCLRIVGPRKVCINLHKYIREQTRTMAKSELEEVYCYLDSLSHITKEEEENVQVNYCELAPIIPVFPYGYLCNDRDDKFSFCTFK